MNVARPSIWGNPYTVKAAIEAGYKDGHRMAVWAYREWLNGNNPDFQDHRAQRKRTLDTAIERLKGKHLACWCPLDKPCHADVLLELANGGNKGGNNQCPKT